MMRQHKIGDIVVYAKQRWGTSPSVNARNISAQQTGEQYSYAELEFLRVLRRFDDGTLELATLGEDIQRLQENDPLLRRPTLWERLVSWDKFPREPRAVA